MCVILPNFCFIVDNKLLELCLNNLVFGVSVVLFKLFYSFAKYIHVLLLRLMFLL